MKNSFLQAAIAVGATACVAAAASVVAIALSGKPMRMALTTAAGQVLVEINAETSVIPVYMDQNGQEVLIASSEMP